MGKYENIDLIFPAILKPKCLRNHNRIIGNYKTEKKLI